MKNILSLIMIMSVLGACSSTPNPHPQKDFRHVKLNNKEALDKPHLITSTMRASRETAFRGLNQDQQEQFQDLVEWAKKNRKDLHEESRLKKKWTNWVESLEESKDPVDLDLVTLAFIKDVCINETPLLLIQYSTKNAQVDLLHQQVNELKEAKKNCEKNMGVSCDHALAEQLDEEIKKILTEIQKLKLELVSIEEEINSQERMKNQIMCNLIEVAKTLSGINNSIVYGD